MGGERPRDKREKNEPWPVENTGVEPGLQVFTGYWLGDGGGGNEVAGAGGATGTGRRRPHTWAAGYPLQSGNRL